MDQSGSDSNGRVLPNANALWETVRDADGGVDSWYSKAVAYWDKQEASVDGVLGGYGHLSDTDVRDSRMLLIKCMKAQLEEAEHGNRRLVALDCGAGVGRVTEHLLLHHFHEVDLLEPSQHLLDAAQRALVTARKAKPGGPPATHVAANFYCSGLQQHVFEAGRYDCIWIQWCLLYITDEDVISLMARCRGGLKPDGIIMVKENICREGFVVDGDDSSVSRSNSYMLELFEKADMQVVYNVKQRNFPKEIYEVRMYVLRHRPLRGKAEAAPVAVEAEAMAS